MERCGPTAQLELLLLLLQMLFVVAYTCATNRAHIISSLKNVETSLI